MPNDISLFEEMFVNSCDCFYWFHRAAPSKSMVPGGEQILGQGQVLGDLRRSCQRVAPGEAPERCSEHVWLSFKPVCSRANQPHGFRSPREQTRKGQDTCLLCSILGIILHIFDLSWIMTADFWRPCAIHWHMLISCVIVSTLQYSKVFPHLPSERC